ncbi:MAG TPA: class E sortase [Nocardioides sp.]|nr:class E sortase [Nocardioides sp.]
MSAPTLVRTDPVDASPLRRADRTAVRLVAARSLTTLALLLVWLLAYLLVLSGFQQGHAQHALYATLRTELAEGTAPAGAPIPPGAPVALLEIPGIDLDPTVVVEGTRSPQLQTGPGHLTGSVLPGQAGVSVLAGRAVSFGRPFARVPDLRRGDSVIVTTGQGRFVYRVSGARLAGDPAPQPPAAGGSRLTLVTALGGSSRLGGLQASRTVYVDAELSGDAVAPGPRAGRDPQRELLAPRVDSGSLAQLALALQLLGAVLAGAVWSWRRWSRRGTWVVGVPVVLAALWLASSIATRFLPALV